MENPDIMGSGRMRAQSLCLIVLALVFSATAGTSDARPEIQPLRGQNLIAFTESASMLVHIPADAELDTPAGNSRSISVKNTEDFAGFVLVQNGTDDPLVIIGGRLPTAEGERDFVMPISLFPDHTGENLEHFKNYPDALTVPAGTYELFVFSESGGGKIRLDLKGLQGKTRLSPRRPAPVEIERPTPQSWGAANDNLYSGGSMTELTSKGLLFNALWLEHSGYIAGQFGFCHYENGSEIEPLVFVPGCPNGRASAISNNRMVESEPGVRVQLLGWSSLSPGEHAHGAWYTTESMVERASHITVALDYGDSV